MDSRYLKENGFSQDKGFNLQIIRKREERLHFSGLYVFVLKKSFPRLKGKTNILYIGQSGQGRGRFIYERVNDYIRASPHAPQDKRIGEALKELNGKNKVSLFVKEISPYIECKAREKALIDLYFKDHTELPPLNRSH